MIFPPPRLPQQHFASSYPSASSWNGFEIRSLLLLHSKFHACPFPPSLCLFHKKAFMSMLPAVPEKFSRRAVFLRALMRYNYPYVKSRAVTREVVNDFFRFRRQGCPKGHITRAAYITRSAYITRATSQGQPRCCSIIFSCGD